MIFKSLSRDEYERLTLEERIEYLRQLQDDIRQKIEETHRRIGETNKLLDRSGH